MTREKALLSYGTTEVLFDGRMTHAALKLAESNLSFIENTGSKLVPLSEIVNAKSLVEKAGFGKKKFLILELSDGKQIRIALDDAELWASSIQEAKKVLEVILIEEKRAKQLLAEGKMVCARLDLDVNAVAEALRKKKGFLQQEEKVVGIAKIYFPFAICRVHGPIHLAPKDLLVRLAVPREAISALLSDFDSASRRKHFVAGAGDVVHIMEYLFPTSPAPPSMDRFVELLPTGNEIVVPPNIDVIECFELLTPLYKKVDSMNQGYEDSFNSTYDTQALKMLNSNFLTAKEAVQSALFRRLFADPMTHEVLHVFFLPFLLITYQTLDGKGDRWEFLDCEGRSSLLEVAFQKTKVSFFETQIDQILSIKMYNGTQAHFSEKLKSLIASGGVNEARRIYDEAMRFYPYVITTTFDELVDSVRQRTPQPATPEKDYWAVLGLRPGATPEVIKAVYQELMKQYHVDKLPAGATPAQRKLVEDKVKEINEANDALMRQAG
ncbi:MAG: J domain-containing protein [Nitrososphaerales archaeon]|nr:J domain-containing protein [Nitrososphaerales archaeon]